MHPVDYIYAKVGNKKHLDFVNWTPLGERKTVQCTLCQRPSSDWAYKFFAIYPNTYSKGQMDIQCPGCHVFIAGHADYLGFESKAKGKLNRLGMMIGVSAVISAKENHLYVSSGYYEKLKDIPNCPFTLHLASPRDVVPMWCEQPFEYPAVFIRELNRNSAALIENLYLSTSPTDIRFCSARMQAPFDYTLARKLVDHVHKESPAAAKAVKQTQIQVARGMLNPRAKLVVSASEAAPDLAKFIQHLPVNPLLRINLLESI